jgi:hypothetical protein
MRPERKETLVTNELARLQSKLKNMLAGTVLGDKLRAKGLTWVPEKKEPPKKKG